MKSTFLPASLAALALLGGCAANAPRYAGPSSGPTATVRFSTPVPTINNPVLIHTSQCTDKDASLVGLLYSKAIGEPYREAIEVQVPANQSLGVSMLVGDVTVQPGIIISKNFVSIPYTTSTCRAIVDFVPKAGARYEVRYLTDLKQCHYQVEEVRTGSNGLTERVPEPSAKLRAGCELPAHWAP